MLGGGDNVSNGVLTDRRIFYWDNLKGFLIFLVVLGHMIEQLLPDGMSQQLYKVIYLFHMPLFVFCSGYLSRFSPRKILKQLLLPYVVIQVVFGLIAFREIQVSTPYWLLWYLLALAFWRMTTPFLDMCTPKLRWIVVAAAVAVSCLVGFDDTVGYHASLSRIAVFYPYFVTGYYAQGWKRTQISSTTKIAAAAVLAVLLGSFFFLSVHVDARWLYGVYSYRNGDYNILFRLGHYLVAAAVGWAMLVLTPFRKTFFAPWGRSSFVIYLAHPFVLYALMYLMGMVEIAPWVLYGVSFAAAVGVCAAAAAVSTWVRKRKTGRFP